MKTLTDTVAVKRVAPDTRKIRITSPGGMVYTAFLRDVTITDTGRLLAMWDCRYGLDHNPAFRTALNAAMVGRIEYAR